MCCNLFDSLSLCLVVYILHDKKVMDVRVHIESDPI